MALKYIFEKKNNLLASRAPDSPGFFTSTRKNYRGTKWPWEKISEKYESLGKLSGKKNKEKIHGEKLSGKKSPGRNGLVPGNAGKKYLGPLVSTKSRFKVGDFEP